jgi:hypothetical protein
MEAIAGRRTFPTRLYHLAFEKAELGAIYHAVDEEGVSMKAIAEALARGLKVPVISIKPEEAQQHFGWLSIFAGHDMPASSALTPVTGCRVPVRFQVGPCVLAMAYLVESGF